MFSLLYYTFLLALLFDPECIFSLVCREYLQNLDQLRELNLSYSWLTNEGVLHLLKLDQLERTYIFGTEVDNNLISAMRKHLPGLELLLEEGPYF